MIETPTSTLVRPGDRSWEGEDHATYEEESKREPQCEMPGETGETGMPVEVHLVGEEIAAAHPAFTLRRHIAWLCCGLVCLISAWYFAYAIAPAGFGLPAIPPDLYPAWYASRQVLFHQSDPYGAEVTKQIQLKMLRQAVQKGSQPINQHKFAYPLYSVLIFSPFALLPFKVAQAVAFVSSVVLTIFSVFWWLPRAATTSKTTLVVFTLASYPVVLGLQLRQPTMLIAPLLAAVVFSLSRNKLVLAGCLAAICTAKPQLAVAVLLPLLVWAFADWRARKAFVISLALFQCGLLAVSELMLRGWFSLWLRTLREYAQYAGAKPRLFLILPPRLVWLGSAILVGAVIWVSWRWRDSDLLFAVCFSIAVFQLIFLFHMYNEVMLLPAVLWFVSNAAERQARGQLFVLLQGCLWIVLGAGWIATLGLSIRNLVYPGSAARLLDFPMAFVGLFPFVVVLVLATYAVWELIVFRSRSSWGNRTV